MGMTLLKAAEILELNAKEAGTKMPADVREAVFYGADALRHVDYHRKAGHIFAQKLLKHEISGGS